WAAMLALPLAARANPGDLDPSFGTGGQVITPILSGYDGAGALVLQPDGKLVAAGHAYNANNNTLALVRYNADGSLDGNFGTGGKVTTAIGTASGGAALVLQPNGKLVAAGYTFTGSRTQFALVRYLATGSLDTSFGTGGKVATPISSIDDEVSALVLQPDGKLVAAGYANDGSNMNFALVRYNADGSLDTSFGTGGKVTTPIESIGNQVFALVLQPDGKLVAAGYANDGSNQDFALVRYSPDGNLDGSFGAGGKVITPVSGTFGEVNALVLQPDGKLVAAGYSYNGSDTDFALARYLGQVFGDGIVQAPEQCDDGAANGTFTSCCTMTCQFNGSGTSCDDGNACTDNDSCDGSGACVGTAIAGCTTTTTTTTSSTTSTTTPCPDSGFEGVGCILRIVVQPCAG